MTVPLGALAFQPTGAVPTVFPVSKLSATNGGGVDDTETAALAAKTNAHQKPPAIVRCRGMAFIVCAPAARKLPIQE
jgi:hypothetical protein